VIGELLLLGAITVLPSDRLALADRLFNKGLHAEAMVEYEALRNEPSIAPDELLYRFAECDRAAGRNESACRRYAELYGSHPLSKYAERARFMYAMGQKGDARKSALAALDTDRIKPEIRAAALYHLGVESSDADVLGRCIAVDPKGKYAVFARLRQATILASAADAAKRRKGLELLLGIAFGEKGEIAEEALYLAAVQSYREKRYGEAGSLFRRYLKACPKSTRLEDVRTMAIWSDYMLGRYADAVAACGKGGSDDTDYILAACAYAVGEDEKARDLFKRYLADHPTGKYRADAELPLTRLDFKWAEKEGDASRAIESAQRSYGLSKLPADQLRLAWAYERAGRADEAVVEYQRVAKSFPGTEEAADALFRKAMMDAREERWNAAELTLAEALAGGKCGKRTAEALYWRGVAAMRTGHEAEAVGFLRQAVGQGLSLDESREARLLIADYELRNGEEAAAKKAYEKLVAEGACERMSTSRILAVGKLLGGDLARTCARELIKHTQAEWRQAGYALLGEAEEKAGSFAAAIDAYRKCLEEKANVAEAATAALNLGRLESRAGEFDRAEATLKRAVALNGTDAGARGAAYLALAVNSEAKKDFKSACAYATVVVSLYDDQKLCAEAKKILAAHPQEDE